MNAKARTSFSIPLHKMKVCEVANVHAVFVWEPPQTESANVYDPSKLIYGKSLK